MRLLATTFYIIIIFSSLSCDGIKKTQIKSKTKLNDLWMLHSIHSESYDKSSLKHPRLEFNIREEKFYGNDGCNQITGSIKQLTNKSIRFSGVVGTRMRCLNMEISREYLSLLQKTRYYSIQNLHLTLLDSNKNKLLAFTKAE